MLSIAQLAELVIKNNKQTNGKQVWGLDFIRPNMLEEERVAMCPNQEAQRKMHMHHQPLLHIFWECTTLLSYEEASSCHEEASSCHKEAGTHFDKKKQCLLSLEPWQKLITNLCESKSRNDN